MFTLSAIMIFFSEWTFTLSIYGIIIIRGIDKLLSQTIIIGTVHNNNNNNIIIIIIMRMVINVRPCSLTLDRSFNYYLE